MHMPVGGAKVFVAVIKKSEFFEKLLERRSRTMAALCIVIADASLVKHHQWPVWVKNNGYQRPSLYP